MRVLIADDDPIFRTLLSRSLTSWGHEVMEVEDGQEAYNLLRCDPSVEMVILDWMMPVVDGLELCRKLRAEWTSSFYIIIVTSAQEHGNILNALGSGADDYIRKPFDTAELKARVDLGERTFRLHRNLIQTCRAAEKSEGQIRSLLDSADEGIYGVDPEGCCTFINQGAANAFGYTREEMIGKSMHQLVHYQHADGRDFPWCDCAVLEVMRTGQAHREAEATLWKKDSSSFMARYSSSPIMEDSKLTGAVVAFRDITEERKLEERLRQSAKLEAVGRLAGGVAHDFNNMLTVIHGYSELMLRKLNAGNPLRHYAEAILNAADRSATITQQLLAFSRRQVVQREMVNLNDVVEGMRSLLKQLVGEDIHIQSLLRADEGKVFADPGQIGQVVMNLAVNARDAMRGGGTLRIETANVSFEEMGSSVDPPIGPGDFVMLAVSDTGCGMDAETRAHIFEPFFTTKPKGEGTGLGLAMVYGIVQQNGGHIRVDSEAGAGSTFTVYFPLSNQASEVLSDVNSHGKMGPPVASPDSLMLM